MDDLLSSGFDDAFDRIASGRTGEQEEVAKANGQLRELPQLVVARGNLPARLSL